MALFALYIEEVLGKSDYAMGWATQGSNPSKDKRYYTAPNCPSRHWVPPTLLSSE